MDDLTHSNLADRLAAVPMFAEVTDKARLRIARQMRQFRFGPGQPVVVAEDSQPVRTGRMFVILDGEADVLRDGTVVAHLGAGDHFGEMALLDGGPRSADVEATSPLHVAALASWNFTPLLAEEPEIALAVIRALTARLREVSVVGQVGIEPTTKGL